VLQRLLHSTQLMAWEAIFNNAPSTHVGSKTKNDTSTINTERRAAVEEVWGVAGITQNDLSRWTVVPATLGHYAYTLNDCLAERTVHKRLASRKCDFEWTPQSPDMQPPDFHLWITNSTQTNWKQQSHQN